MTQILHFQNYLDKETCSNFVKFIDNLLPQMLFDTSKQRHILRYGYDQEYPEHTIQNTDLIEPIKDILFDVFDKMKTDIKAALHNDTELFLTSFFISKHLPGGSVNEHADASEDMNACLKYSCVLYLNDIGNDGAITFPFLGKTIQPMTGDLVVFPSLGEDSTHSVAEITGPRYAIPVWFTEDEHYKFPYDYAANGVHF